MNTAIPNDIRPELRLKIAEQKLIRDAAETEIKRLQTIYDEIEKELPICWVVVKKADETQVRFVDRKKFHAELAHLSLQNYQDYEIREWTLEKANSHGIKIYED